MPEEAARRQPAMRARDLDPYIDGASPIHNLDPRTKLLAASAYVVAVLAAPAEPSWVLIALSLALLPAMAVSGVPLGRLAARTVPACGLIALASIGLLFEGSPQRFLAFSCKALDCTVAAVVFTAVTPYHHLLAALRWMRLPGVLIAVAGIAYRLVFVVMEEAVRTATAYRCRVPTAGAPRRARHAFRMAQSLIARSVARSQRLEYALLARGFDGTLHGLPLRQYSPREALGTALAVFLLAAVSLAARR